MSILSWLRRKPRGERRYSDAFNLPDDLFAEFTTELVASYSPNGQIQLLIALKNLSVIYDGFVEYQESVGKTFSINEIIKKDEDLLTKQTDEIIIRRLHYFCQACFILRCTEDQERSRILFDSSVEIWINFLKSHHVLQDIIRHNVIWSDLEKSFFVPLGGTRNESLKIIAGVSPDNIASDKRFIEAYKRLNGGRRPLLPRTKHGGSYKTTIN